MALICVLGASVLTETVRPILDQSASQFLFFVAAVAISAGYGDVGPGLAATVLSAISLYYLVVPPIHSFQSPSAANAAPLGLFLAVGVFLSGLSHLLRAELRRAETAYAETDSARRRLAFLAGASAALDASLDYETILDNLVHLAVPYLADWCAIDGVEEDRSVRPLVVAHVDPQKEALVRGLECRYPLDPQGQHPVPKALRTGQAALYLDIPESALVAAARDEAHLAAFRSLGFRSYLCVPLRGRDRMLGTVLFVSSARHRYNDTDRALAEDLVGRAALALDNARLYSTAQAEIDERKRTEEALAYNQQQIQSLNDRLKRAMIETHHRVKNNLQIITAMVDMRLMDAKDGSATVSVEDFERLGAYVRALATVHEILTQEAKEDGEMQDVSVRAVLEKLLPLMQETAGERRIEFNLEDARLPPKQSTSLALIVNELISNAIKYGKGEIAVDMRIIQAADGPSPTVRILSSEPLLRQGSSAGRRLALLEVCDDGPGFPPGFDPAQAGNTGLDLIETLSRWDLGGETRYENRPDGGAKVSIAIPLPEPDVTGAPPADPDAGCREDRI